MQLCSGSSVGVCFVSFACKQAPWGREHLVGTSLHIASQTKPLISGLRCYQNETVGLWCIKLTGCNTQLKRAQCFKGGNSIPAPLSTQTTLEAMRLVLSSIEVAELLVHRARSSVAGVKTAWDTFVICLMFSAV